MVSFDDLLGALYEIQGLSDPGTEGKWEEVPAENIQRIYDIACAMMAHSGYSPE